MINSPRVHKHKPLLPGNQIRLLVLYPAKHLNSPICCSLLQTCLDDITDINTASSPYEVLLGWGSDSREHEIICDGRRMQVPQNCQVALRYLRHKFGTRTLWVDATCVNQLSTTERSHHTRLTPDIFKHAKNVLVWMGETEEPVNKVIRRAALVGKYLQFLDNHAIKHPNSDAAGVRKMLTTGFYKRFSTDNVPSRWFTRLAVLQEVDIVVACDPILVSGYASIPLKHFQEWCKNQPKKTADRLSSRLSSTVSPRISSTMSIGLGHSTTASVGITSTIFAGSAKETEVKIGRISEESPEAEFGRDSLSPSTTTTTTDEGKPKRKKLQKRFSSGNGIPLSPVFPVKAAG